MVPARFIKSSTPTIVQSIVEYNNSQNKMESADFRSNDRIQNRLRREFQEYHADIRYTGGKRGGVEDRISRNPNIISSDTVAQSLTAFHGRPKEAYNNKSRIWRENNLYNAIFDDQTSAEHIIFVYSLNSIINKMKIELMARSRAGNTFTQEEEDNLSFLRLRGATYLLIASVGACMETLLNKPLPSKFQLQFQHQNKLEVCESYWKTPVQIFLVFNESLRPPLEAGLGNTEETSRAISEFSRMIRGTRIPNSQIYDEFANHVIVD